MGLYRASLWVGLVVVLYLVALGVRAERAVRRRRSPPSHW